MKQIAPTIAIVIFIVIGLVGLRAFKSVPAGHVAVATLFGKPQTKPFREGLHVPVNPLYNWTQFDARQKTHTEQAQVPSQDQLSTTVDVSVQYRIDGDMASHILRDTGTVADAIRVHLVPLLRSALREQGKSIRRAEDFFLEETQQKIQETLTATLKEDLSSKGIVVDAVLLRDIRLPAFITKAIERKKEREQEAERQKAELARFKTEQEQKVAQAEAELHAAEAKASMRMKLADAQAYEIKKINEAVSSNPAYIQLQAMEALKAISNSPSSKIYFLSGDSPMPLPLMHMGDSTKALK
jgi:regulator of protease activity HflC (stomatin/prohibitin superfamily)